MSTLNPYVPPAGKVADSFSSSGEFGEINIFSAKGRLGRIRYLAYSMGVGIVAVLAIALVTVLASFLPGSVGGIVAVAAIGLAYIAMIYVSILLLIQRSHDMGKSGWFALVALIPFAALIFLFWPGAQAANKYGSPPPPTNPILKWAMIILCSIYIVAIIAAIVFQESMQYVG